jgi:hypothetical protein
MRKDIFAAFNEEFAAGNLEFGSEIPLNNLKKMFGTFKGKLSPEGQKQLQEGRNLNQAGKVKKS